MRPNSKVSFNPITRIRFWYALLLIIGGIFVIRLFYLQVIKHDYYQKSANFSQLKEYEIPADRGTIKAKNGDQVVPLVLNETLYTLFADPKYVKDASRVVLDIKKAIGGSEQDYVDKLKNPDSPRYTILAKRLGRNQAEKIDKLELKGVGTRESQYRTYPDGQLAAQILGFVNEEGNGKYGIEQALNDELKGTPGLLKAITDAKGVPLAANKDNIRVNPKAGRDITLTLDIGLQQQLEEILKTGVEKARGKSGSAFIMDANSGAVRAMASYPSFNPAEYFKVSDGNLFNNTSVSTPLEVGSIMKPLTAAAALDLGVVTPESSYYDSGRFVVDEASITNVEEVAGAGTRNVKDILNFSLNTGATWLLMQMGGGKINEQARTRWHDYMINHYQLGKATGIEQGYEAEGIIPDPTDGFGLNITFANSAFGQGMTATPLQMGAALAAVINGGTYYKPHFTESYSEGEKTVTSKPHIVKNNVIKPSVSRQMVSMLEDVYRTNRIVYGAGPLRSEYSVGGKTGTAQISKPDGGYYEDKYNGTYMGFVGGDKPEFVVVVRVDEPKIAGYAGSKAAAPIFVALSNMLIDSYGVTPRSQ